MLRVAAALLCVAAGQGVGWLIYPAGTTHSGWWPLAALVAAAALIGLHIRRLKGERPWTVDLSRR